MTVLSKITGRPLDVITLRDLVVHCVIGVNPEEKIRSQLLRLDIKLYLDVSPAGLSGILSRTVDYSLIAKQLAFILTHSRFRLLESAAEALAVFLLTPAQGEALIQAVDIEIHKPEALGGEAIPSVRIFRDDESRSAWIRANPPSSILFQVPEAVMERRVIAPKAELLMGEGEESALMIESAGLILSGKTLAVGSTLIGAQRLILHNPNAEERSVLAVTFRGQQRFQLAEDRLH
ncbi:MAG: dihydroneopterin aldolase [Proteobacteria bacterium]|nr:MAG: dihydroneopterin aldolase [Pseudomonadota bacterium]